MAYRWKQIGAVAEYRGVADPKYPWAYYTAGFVAARIDIDTMERSIIAQVLSGPPVKFDTMLAAQRYVMASARLLEED